jgi:hypothetical protein
MRFTQKGQMAAGRPVAVLARTFGRGGGQGAGEVWGAGEQAGRLFLRFDAL